MARFLNLYKIGTSLSFYVLAHTLPISAVAADKNYGSFDKPMIFAVAGSGGNCNGCEWISAIGVIDETTPQKFENFYKEHPYAETIYLHSPGGNLIAGMKLGKLFRKYKMPVSIGKTQKNGYGSQETADGTCASACAYAFLGGISRSIHNNSKIGFHQFYKDSDTGAKEESVKIQGYVLSTDQLLSGLIAAYIVEMGVDARILTIASLGGKDSLQWPNEKELRALKVVTNNSFGPLQMELLGSGIRVFSTNDYVGYPVREVSAFCATKEKQAFFVVETDKVNMSDKELKSLINKIEFSADGEKAMTPISLDHVAIKTRDNTAIIIALPNAVKEQAMQAKVFSFDIDTPRVAFGTFIDGGFSLNPDEQRMLKLAWSNCS